MLDKTDCYVCVFTLPKQLAARSSLKEMERGFSGGQAFLRFFYPDRGSNILPETVEAKTKKSFLTQQHSGISVLGCAELSKGPIRLQIVKDPWLQNLDARKHELRDGTRKRRVDSCLEKSMDSSIAVDVHRAILISQRIES